MAKFAAKAVDLGYLMNVMIWNAARGGMRSVVEAYERDGFIADNQIYKIAAYVDGGFLTRQLVFLRAITRFLILLLRGRVDLVHIHAAMRGSFFRKSTFAMLARRFGCPVVLHLHGSEMKLFYNALRPMARRYVTGQLEAADCVIVLSQSWQDYVASIAPHATIKIVPNHVAIGAISPIAARDRHALLMLGLIGQRKGVYDLLPAIADVVRTRPDVRLVLGGNGEVEVARKMVDALGLDAIVSLPGWVSGDAKQAFLDAAAIYILPSHNEGLPVSILEAMAAGCAVIATKVGGIPELIEHGTSGLLVDAGDIPAITRAIDQLIGDDAARIAMAQAGFQRVAAYYSDVAVLPQLQAIYDALHARRAPRANRASTNAAGAN